MGFKQLCDPEDLFEPRDVIRRIMPGNGGAEVTCRLAKWSRFWWKFVLGDRVIVFMIYSWDSRMTERGGLGSSWSFVFRQEHLREMREATLPVWLALVCGYPIRWGSRKQPVCLLDPDQVKEVLDYQSESPQRLTVRSTHKSWLRVYKDRKERFKVPHSRRLQTP